MSTTQHEAILLADMLGFVQSITPMPKDAARLLRQQHALIVQMAEALNRIDKAGLEDDLLDLEQPTWQAISSASHAIEAAKDYLK